MVRRKMRRFLPTRDALRELLRDHFPYLVLLGVATALYVAVASVQWYAIDEGSYLNAASTILHGGIPFRTFAAREPAMLYYLAVGDALFGPNLLVARLQIVLVDLGTGTIVYLLGRELGGKRAGLAAAALFFFNPFDVYSFTTVLLEPLAALPLVLIAYLLLRRKEPDLVWIPLSIGFLLGVAELTRRDSILLAPVMIGLLWVRLRPRLSMERFRALTLAVIGFALPVVIVLGYYLSQTSLTWMWDEYGLGGAYASNPVAFNYHFGVLYYLWVYEPFLAVPAAAVPAYVLAARGQRELSFLALGLSALLLGFVLYAGPSNYSWGQGEFSFVTTEALAPLLLGLWVLIALDLTFDPRPSGPRVKDSAVLYLGLWSCLFLGFYTVVYPEFFTNYFSDVSVPLSLLAGLWWSDRVWGRLSTSPSPGSVVIPSFRPVPQRRRSLWVRQTWALCLAAVVLGSALFSAAEVLGPSNPYNQPLTNDLPQYNVVQRTYAPSLVDEVAQYLDRHSPANATLFSADDIFLAQAHRANLLNLSIVLTAISFDAYPNNQTAYPDNPYDLAPSIEDLLNAWNHTWVPLVVVGFSGTNLEKNHPAVATYISDHYYLAETFGNGYGWNAVSVWARGTPPVNAGSLTGEYAVGPVPVTVAVDTSNGTVFTGSLNSSELYALSPGGRNWTYSLPNCSGVRELAYDAGTGLLWVGYAGAEVGRVLLTNGSPPKFQGASPVGYVPISISFDDRRHLAFAASQVFSNVTVMNASTGRYVTSYEVAPDPTAIVAEAATGILYEASAGDFSLQLYNESTGTAIATIPVGFAPTNLVLTPHDFLLTRWNPGLVLLINRTDEVSAPFPVGGGALGMAVLNGSVAVANQINGTVTLFNPSTQLPEGILTTGGCPTALAFSVSGSDLYTTGPCATPLQEWRMGAPVNWTIHLPGSGIVTLDGSIVPVGRAIQVYPGIAWITTNLSGYVPLLTSTYVPEGGGVWLAPTGASVVDTQNYEGGFGLGALGATLLALLLTVVHVPSDRERVRPRASTTTPSSPPGPEPPKTAATPPRAS